MERLSKVDYKVAYFPWSKAGKYGGRIVKDGGKISGVFSLEQVGKYGEGKVERLCEELRRVSSQVGGKPWGRAMPSFQPAGTLLRDAF